MLGLSDRIRAIALLDERDARFEAARALHDPANGRGLTFDQGQHMHFARQYHSEAVELLASAHSDYRPAPWAALPSTSEPLTVLEGEEGSSREFALSTCRGDDSSLRSDATETLGALEALYGDCLEAQVEDDLNLIRSSTMAAAAKLLEGAGAGRAPVLTADFTRSLPGGKLDDSAYEAIEAALDRADAPCMAGERWLTLAERVEALAANRKQPCS